MQPECTDHYQCADTKLCHQGSCQEACRFQECGVNALCIASNHVGSCVCREGYEGRNPNLECHRRESMRPFVSCQTACSMFCLFLAPTTSPAVISGCEDNEECPDHAACENRLCINPCATRDPCAPLATCRVIRHEPVCTCPDGYLGSADVECTPRE